MAWFIWLISFSLFSATFFNQEGEDQEPGLSVGPLQAITITEPVEVIIPEIARGYEDIYKRFLKSVLIYKPNEKSDEGIVEIPISSLSNPLDETFDLSRCGDVEKYLSISTGYKKGKKLENSGKTEIWIVPKFIVEQKLKGWFSWFTSAQYFQDIMDDWVSPVGIFFTHGGWELSTSYYYSTSCFLVDSLNKANLYGVFHSHHTQKHGNAVSLTNWFRTSWPGERMAEKFYFAYKGIESEISTHSSLVSTKSSIPKAILSYEEIYQRFINGKLVYKPNPESEEGIIELPIAGLNNPLEGIFDLSKCGNVGKYVSIATGYKKEKKTGNSQKLEIWIVPRFIMEKELGPSYGKFFAIREACSSPVNVFWTWGGWDNLGWYDYLTQDFNELSNGENLYKKWQQRVDQYPHLTSRPGPSIQKQIYAPVKFFMDFN